MLYKMRLVLMFSMMLSSALYHGFAQTSANYAAKWYTLSAGYGSPSSSTYKAFSFIGQPIIGGTVSANYHDESGFGGDPIKLITAVDEKNPTIPLDFILQQNYPNPFNPITMIEYELPKSTYVTISIYNVLGDLVTLLVNGEKEPGKYHVKLDASSLSSGIYFYRIRAGSFVETKKLVVMK